MPKWKPNGLVSPLHLPKTCSDLNVIAAWVPVGDVTADGLPLDLSNVPLVDTVEAATFVTQKRAAEHAAARYALATLLRDIGFDPIDLRIVRDEYRKPNLMWSDAVAETRAGDPLSPSLPEITLGHSNGIAIAAVSLDGSLIGLDAEPLDVIRPRNLLTMMASGDELQYLEDHWATDERAGMQESTRTWVVKEAVQKASGLGMHVPPQSFSVLNTNQVFLVHQDVRYILDAVHWQQLLDERPFVFGFSRLTEVINLNLNP